MFTIEKNGESRLDIEFSGKIDAEAMKVALVDLFHKSQGIENGTMLYRIRDFDLPTLGAIGVELSNIPDLFKLIGKFDKAAVLANQHWIRVVSQIEGALIPGLEIKAFELDQKSEAKAWLAE